MRESAGRWGGKGLCGLGGVRVEGRGGMGGRELRGEEREGGGVRGSQLLVVTRYYW